MRNTTREKLFDDSEKEYIVLWSVHGVIGDVSLLSVGGALVLVHEFANERDGFEVYVKVPGNNVDDTRVAMGLKRKTKEKTS